MRDEVRERIYRCDCSGPHFLTVVRHEWPEGRAYLGLEDYCEAIGWWQCLKAAWNILRHGHHDWCEIILSPKITREISTELEATAHWLETKAGVSVVKPETVEA